MSTYDGGPAEARWEACQTCVAERDAARVDAARLAAALRMLVDLLGGGPDDPMDDLSIEIGVAVPAALAAHDALTGDA